MRVMGSQPLTIGAADWTPPACTLPTEERPLRVAEFDQLFATALHGVRRTDPTGLVLEFAADPAQVASARDLIRRETECCSFFTFTVEDVSPLLRVRVEVPPAHTEVLAALGERAAHLMPTA